MSAATDYIQLTHAASEIDGTIDEVYAARGSYGNLGARIGAKQDELTAAQQAAVDSGITAAKLEDLESIFDWEAFDIFKRTGQTYIDTQNSAATAYINRSLKRIVIATDITTSTQMTTATDSQAIASISAIAGYNADMIPVMPVRAVFQNKNSNYSAMITKNAVNDALAITCTVGTIPAGAVIQIQFEYQYGLSQISTGTRSAPTLAQSAEPEETEPETGEAGEER